MSNFHPKLQDSTEEQLMHSINEHNPHYASLSSDELTRRTLDKLRETIIIFNEASSKQTDRLVKLTWWIVGLTVAMLVGLVVQIIVAILLA